MNIKLTANDLRNIRTIREELLLAEDTKIVSHALSKLAAEIRKIQNKRILKV